MMSGNILADHLCWSVKGPMRPDGLMNGSASWVCQQISADALWVARLLLCLCFLAPLKKKKRASAADNYRQFKPGQSAQLLRETKSAASTATTQLNFHHRLAKQQSTTKKNLGDNFNVPHKSRIPERSSGCCTAPFISLKAYSCQKIRTNS